MKNNLLKLRKSIDQLDGKVVQLLNKRAQYVLQIKQIKNKFNASFYSPQREQEVYKNVCLNNNGPFSNEILKNIFREVMSGSLALETKLKIAYFGPEGTNTHLAALKKFGTASVYFPVPSIKDVFVEVEKGRADYGLVPVENSTEGTINHTLDLLIDSELKICSEIAIPITHNLMSSLGDLNKIKKIYSHYQAIAQSRIWLETHLPNVLVVEVASTAKAAQLAQKDKTVAAIAPEVAANVYNLKIIARGIEDLNDNITRFLVIGKNFSKATGNDKTSIMISIKDKVGALHKILTYFQNYKVNLTNIESRPSRKKAWDYFFFIDFVGHVNDSKIKKILSDLEESTAFIKVLGSYPKCEL
jgi:chorismate mutase/prephenate dehydratase